MTPPVETILMTQLLPAVPATAATAIGVPTDVAPPVVNPGRILDLSWGIARTGTLTAALDLDVFTQVADGARSARDIAVGSGTDRAATGTLLTALAALGLLEPDGVHDDEPTYRLAADAATFLVRGRPAYIGDLRHMHHVLNFRLWPELAAAVSAGGPTADLFARDGSAVWTQVTPYLDQVAEVAARWLSATLAPGLRDGARVLDVGCGSGAYSRLLARSGLGVQVTGLDRPEVIALADRLAADAGLAGRICHRAGDLREVDWAGPGGSGYDLVLLSNLLHGYDEPGCVELLQRAASVLRPGGQVAVFEVVPDPVRALDNPVAAFFSLQMLMTSGGRAYSQSEYGRLFRRAGLTQASVTRCPVGPHTLLTAAPLHVPES